MLRRQADVRASRIVWRMTEPEPVSVDIDLTAMESEIKPPLDPNDRGWLESSYELRHGLDVRELPMARLPGDLLRAFARSRR
jgi:hypothetical protein